ncbi:xylulokinase [Paenibacillus phyllosphaerae]|uniref:Xylulokinase n=1 Tax=Paenibacillus phyllosphaerae TaxID=274593 RepID=A0A7W5FN88_9BACL|nr:FGGY family carbohydrate kinase [Paenibacillus phyllosphaerae]MBB3111040.1 xylulokinase [Paenibacillus phyllosphaerae]
MLYFISADIGTQGTKAAVIDEQGTIIATSFQPSTLIRRAGGVVKQSPDEMFQSVLEGIRCAMDQSTVPRSQVAAIGLAGQMAGVIGIDRDWNPVTSYDSWLDARCESEMPGMKAWGEEAIIRITGCPVTYAHGPKKLWWKRERPEMFERIGKFVVPSAYVAGKLAGLKAKEAFIDHTHLHFSGFADVERLAWSEELMRAFGMDKSKLPRIVPPWEVIGRLKRPYADLSGLPEGVPIVAGCGDTAAAAFGAGMVRPGRLLDIAGTASVLSCAVNGYTPDTESKTLIYARSVLPDLWAPLAYVNGGGECLAWYRRLVGSADITFDQLNALAEEVPAGCDDLLFIPHFNGRTCPNTPELRGSWAGLNWAHGQGAMYRAIMEAIAYEYKHYVQILGRLAGRVDLTQATVVGGGAKGELFNRIKADVLGIELRTLTHGDSALTANAAIAGYGIGLFDDLAGAAESFVSYDRTFLPDTTCGAEYERHAARYRIAVEGMAQLYGRMNQS